jgi:hypothetical protein
MLRSMAEIDALMSSVFGGWSYQGEVVECEWSPGFGLPDGAARVTAPMLSAFGGISIQ